MSNLYKNLINSDMEENMKKITFCLTIIISLILISCPINTKQNSRFTIKTYQTDNLIEPRMRHQVTRTCNGNTTIYFSNWDGSSDAAKANYTFYATLNIFDNDGTVLSASWKTDSVAFEGKYITSVYAMASGYPSVSTYSGKFKPIVGVFNYQGGLLGAGEGGVWTVNSDGPR